MSLLHQLVYYIQKYSICTLYPTSSNSICTEYPSYPVSITTATVNASSQQILHEFKSHYGILLLPDIWRVKVDIYASGHQSTSRAQLSIELLINDSVIYTSSFQPIPYTNSPGSMWYDVYIPGIKETDQLSLRILAKNTNTNSHTNTFYLYLHEGYTYMKK
jgi:hypothetical protein